MLCRRREIERQHRVRSVRDLARYQGDGPQAVQPFSVNTLHLFRCLALYIGRLKGVVAGITALFAFPSSLVYHHPIPTSFTAGRPFVLSSR